MSDLHLGDCMDIMAGMDSNSVDALVTDPPAGISFMGKAWDKHNRYEPRSYRAQETYSMLVGVLDMEPWEAGFVAFTIDWALEALRVLKPGAHGLVWALPRTIERDQEYFEIAKARIEAAQLPILQCQALPIF